MSVIHHWALINIDSIMHQGHNIPWSTLSSNFWYIQNDTRYTPPRTGLIARENPNIHNELKHFIKKFVQAIRTFSETERKKYPATFESPSSGNVFSDELRLKYPEYLNEKNQRIEYWIRRGANGDLADVVKILLDENEIPTLLMLAHHPSISLKQLHNLHHGYHYGFNRVKESAADSYIFFNAAEVTGILESGVYADKDIRYSRFMRDLIYPGSHPAQTIPHLRFLEDCGILNSWNTPDAMKSLYSQNYACLQEYLKELFALMYRYDLVVRECGLDPEWEQEIASKYPFAGHADLKWDESQGRHYLA